MLVVQQSPNPSAAVAAIKRNLRRRMHCPVGMRRYVGKGTTGKVYEQRLRVRYLDQTLTLRRITIVLNKPTSRGDTEIHLVTNLTHKATKLAELYLQRWTIENVFQELGQALHSEINTLCYPQAGLLAFCVAVYTYHILILVLVSGTSARLSAVFSRPCPAKGRCRTVLE